jgi:hypothetical protein
MLFIYKKDKGILIPILLLLVLNIFRGYSVGADYERYHDSYSCHKFAFFLKDFSMHTFIENIGLDKSNELGWKFLNYLGDKNGVPFYIVNLFAAALILYFVYKMIREQSPYPIFSVYLYFMLYLFFPSFNIIRQSIAVAIFAYSIRYINEDRPFMYVLFCLLASIFHVSALLLPVLYFLKYIKINLACCIIFLLVSFVIPILNLDQPILSAVFDKNVLDAYANLHMVRDNNALNEMGYIMEMFLLIIPMLIFIYCCLINGCNNIYMKLWLLGIFIQNFTMNYAWLFRITGYFLIAQIIALPLVVLSNKAGARERQLSYFIIIGYSLTIFICKMYSGHDGIVPYVLNTF